jgi:DNA-binding XRE family transcriptional regulator
MNALVLQPVAETADTVTLRRADYEALTELLQDARDLADADAVALRLAAGLTETFPVEVAERLLDGVSPIRVLREYRGMAAADLAAAAGLTPSDLAALEAGGSDAAPAVMAQIAAALRVARELLD